eukprot:308018-Alexandrium_andersonii.AAC.1
MAVHGGDARQAADHLMGAIADLGVDPAAKREKFAIGSFRACRRAGVTRGIATGRLRGRLKAGCQSSDGSVWDAGACSSVEYVQPWHWAAGYQRLRASSSQGQRVPGQGKWCTTLLSSLAIQIQEVRPLRLHPLAS